MPLVVAAGWNQTADDWRFMLAHGQGIGIAEGDRFVASALALPLGPRLSWLSMVLVLPEHRKRGFGTRLLRRCIDLVEAQGAVPGLDATELGRPVYLKLGFSDLYPVSRLRCERPPTPPPPGCTIRPMRPDDLAAVAAFDAPRSGQARAHVLENLQARAPDRALVAEKNGRLAGFALGRPGRMTPQVGPVVADEAAVGADLAAHALAAVGGPAILDVPDAHAALIRLLAAAGAVRQRGFMRMVLGPAPAGLADPSAVFALAGPELA